MDQKSKKVFAINNYIVNKTDRLSSLSKRDLSLGSKQPKKVYKPNLNVVRNKTKIAMARDNTGPQYQRSEQQTAGTSSKHRQNIQTIKGAEGKRANRRSGRYIRKKDPYKIDATTSKLFKREVNIQDENTVINELLADDIDDNTDENEGTIRSLFNCDVPLSFQNNNLYNENRLCLSLFRMPDMLLSKGFLGDSKQVIDVDFTKVVEGKIGRVLIRRSGQVEIQIADTKYVLDSMEMNPFKEDIISISPSFEPNMINLGNIDERYNLSFSLKNIYPSRIIQKRKLYGKK